MQNVGLEDSQAAVKISGRNTATSDIHVIHSNGRKRRELKRLLMKVNEEIEKADLKLNIEKTKIRTSGPITL